MENFNPNDIGLPNGNFFALPYTVDEAEIVLIAVPWDVTTSYRAGTSNGPQAIIDASVQVDLHDVDVDDAWKIKIGTNPFNKNIYEKSKKLRKEAEKVIMQLESGEKPNNKIIAKINAESEKLNNWLYVEASKYAEHGKTIAVVGGEHSVPFGLIKLMDDMYPNFGILHIDAHADLRKAYEGFEYSHASIMNNVISKCKNVKKLVQVGIRDFCDDEAALIAQNKKIHTYTDSYLCEKMFSGEQNWKSLCDEIVAQLPQNVYVSFDIDGLNPALCPNTGTPVPGGLSYQQAQYLLKTLAFSGKKIVGFDLNEVAPNSNNENDEWDANVGSRVLFKLCCLTHYANKNIKK